MERKLSTTKYIIAFVLTFMIFFGGVLIGILLENARLGDSKQKVLEQKVELQSLQLQKSYIDSGITDCKALNKVLEASLNQLVKKMAIVNDYQRRSVFNEGEFELQLREYFLTEMQYFLIAKEIDKKCEQDSIKIIYFYDENKFDTQGDILGYMKNLFGPNLLIFSFNSKFEQEPMINILMTYYKIDQFPALVIGEDVLQGHQKVEKLMELVCGKFEELGNVPKECNGKTN